MLNTTKNPSTPVYTIEPWSYACHNGVWGIEGFCATSGKREIIATLHPVSGFTAEALARYIVGAVNNFEKREHLINEMETALEICLESKDGKLTFTAEHDAEVALRHSRARKAQS